MMWWKICWQFPLAVNKFLRQWLGKLVTPRYARRFWALKKWSDGWALSQTEQLLKSKVRSLGAQVSLMSVKAMKTANSVVAKRNTSSTREYKQLLLITKQLFKQFHKQLLPFTIPIFILSTNYLSFEKHTNIFAFFKNLSACNERRFSYLLDNFISIFCRIVALKCLYLFLSF